MTEVTKVYQEIIDANNSYVNNFGEKGKLGLPDRKSVV